MTFTEAAIEVLRREGKPLHFKKIAEIAIRENLLDHVGKVPEETMADQLAAHCRQPRAERRVAAVQPGTFALVEWGLDEDPAGLEGLVEPPVEDELLYRSRERHPVPSRDVARSAARGEGGRIRRREEEERRGRRFPPPAEVAYEILAGAGRPLGLVEIAAQGAERLLMPDAFVRDTASLQAALAEDNRRRESAGRKPLFSIDGEA
ncbi:MAG TPA: winged helix-turn-helix domain-containing protein, partial [Anaeromyxobacter sp.]